MRTSSTCLNVIKECHPDVIGRYSSPGGKVTSVVAGKVEALLDSVGHEDSIF